MRPVARSLSPACAAALVCFMMASPLTSRAALGAGYDRPAGDPQASRSAVTAVHGMVATS